jgi:hypothetical protein
VRNNEFSPDIVVNSIFTADSLWQFELSTSENIFDPDSKSEKITDATIVVVEANGQLACNVEHIGNGLYKSDGCNPKVKNSYTLYINSPSYGSARATSTVPVAVNASVKLVSDLDGKSTFEVILVDESEDNNYYIWDLVEVELRDTNFVEQIESKTTSIDIESWIDDLSNEVGTIKGRALSSQLSISDDNFDGGTLSTTLIANNDLITSIFKSNEQGIDIEVKTMLRVMTVSKELFEYYRSIETYLAYEDFKTSISDPTIVYSNIEGGIGLFAGYTVQYLNIQ